MKLIFAGTPEFAAIALSALLASAHEVSLVYTQPDRPAGRGRKLQASPVKILAERHRLPVRQPETLRDPDEQQLLRNWGSDVMVVAAYGLLLPKAVLKAPRWGCINIHASLLPRWRGAAPIQRALLAGDHESGVSIMHMQARLDSGPIWSQRRCPILATDTAATLHDRLAQLGAAAMVETLDDLTRVPEPQDATQATYAHKLDKAEAWLDWCQGTQDLDRRVRAFNPYPVAQTRSGDTVIRIWQAAVGDESGPPDAPPGTILAANRSGISVATGDGRLILQQIQLPGGRALAIRDILNAHPQLFQPGLILS